MSPPSLRNSTEFARVLRTGRRARRDGVAVYVARSGASDAPTRFGLAVRCARAVDRNLLKRRLRSVVGSYSPAPGYEVAIRAAEPVLRLRYQELEMHVTAALSAAGLKGGAE